MAIPETQLETWSHQGSKVQSAETYATISGVLNDPTSPYYPKDFETFLQGSYGNDTNVYKDSDVDVVIRLKATYYADTSELDPGSKGAYDRAFDPAPYGYTEFRKDVLNWLIKCYGSDVVPGTKAITIKARGNRREADVLPCTNFRRYRKGSNGSDSEYDEGICFFKTDGTQIINFPKQHSANCTTKHQSTSSRFKPTVRIFKNMRNRMVDDGALKDGIAPSYFIEGMLWNVPYDKFVIGRQNTFIEAYNWITTADKAKLACANDRYWLVRDNSNVCWPTANFDTYIAAVKKFWEAW
jgi:hypothetical protein